MPSRPVHPAALMAVGAVLGWAIAQPFPAPAHHVQHHHRQRPGIDSSGPSRHQTAADGIDRTAKTNHHHHH